MAKKKLVKCPYCGKMIDRDLEFDWSKHSNRYWHDDCWEANKNKPNEKDAVIKKAVEVLGMYADYKLINVQLNQLLKSGYTAEGIIQSLEYFYNVQGNNPNKSNGGIGIVSYVYTSAVNYFQRRKELQDRQKAQKLAEEVESERVFCKPRNVNMPKKNARFHFE